MVHGRLQDPFPPFTLCQHVEMTAVHSVFRPQQLFHLTLTLRKYNIWNQQQLCPITSCLHDGNIKILINTSCSVVGGGGGGGGGRIHASQHPECNIMGFTFLTFNWDCANFSANLTSPTTVFC